MKEEEELTKHQAEAWCRLVAELMIDYGLDWKEPGEVMLEQVQHFLRRKLKPTSAATGSEPQATCPTCGAKSSDVITASEMDKIEQEHPPQDSGATKLDEAVQYILNVCNVRSPDEITSYDPLTQRERVRQIVNAALAAEREKIKPLVGALEWLDEFVQEPEYFPSEGDRQWWQEKRQAIRKLAKVKEGK